MENKDQKINKIIGNNKIFTKSKYLICPQCKKESKIEAKNNDIIIKCENGHEIGPFNSLEHFQESQIIDQSKKKCDCNNCNNIKSNCCKFYRCNTCQMNICDICIQNHSNDYSNHYIINYDEKNFYYCCDKEGHRSEAFNSYCK